MAREQGHDQGRHGVPRDRQEGIRRSPDLKSALDLATVTPSGPAMLADAHHWQEQIFSHLTPDWTNDQRLTFQQAMLILVKRSYDQTA